MLRNSKVFLLDHDLLSRSMIVKSLASEVNYLKEIDDLQMIQDKIGKLIIIVDEEYVDQDPASIKSQLDDFEEAIKVVITDDKDDCAYEFGDRMIIMERPFSSRELYDFALRFYTDTNHAAVESPLCDLSKLRSMSRGNEEFILKMVNIFCKDIPESLQKASDALITHEYDKIKAVLHRIKPSVKMLEINSIIPLLELTEQRAADKVEIEKISTGIRKLKAVLGEVVQKLSEEFNITVQ